MELILMNTENSEKIDDPTVQKKKNSNNTPIIAPTWNDEFDWWLLFNVKYSILY